MEGFYNLLGDYFLAKNGELIYYWHLRKVFSYSLVPSKGQTFVGPHVDECLNVGRSVSDWTLRYYWCEAVHLIYTIFYKGPTIFSTQPKRYLNFSWIELQVLLGCCLGHAGIAMLRCLMVAVIVFLSERGLISVFQEFSASVSKAFILAGGLGIGLSFYAV